MKNIHKILIAFVSILAVSCSADDVENRPVIEKGTTPEFVAPETDKQFVLVEENATNPAERFVWSAATYSDNVVVDYTLLMDVAGGDFTAPQTLATASNSTQASVSVKNLNQAAIELGAVPGEAKQFDLKVMSSVSGGVPMVSAVPLTISINTYSGLIAYEFTDWYFVGDATVSGWDNNKGNQPLFRSGTNPKEYMYTGFFKKGEFKVISNPGSWTPMLGKADGVKMAPRNTDADADPANFAIPTDGYYTFKMNTETLAYTLVAFDAAAAQSYATVGLIGSSTAKGWDGSTAMTQSTFNSHIWTLGVTALNDGEAKFRANDAWDVSWGGKTTFSGGGTGDNIPVIKSKYLIYFNDLDGSYLMIPNQE
ncbi:SusE domain-containing protein [Flavobacterium sp. TAB 87]|uniref:SusE domain-containing protein n=1 Tax=Flavobacterium sp. TAB 87 TaxID=1729581 RepID=UPI00076DB221|nr:SusE domain-containing protein [Flavobacterium sp. TAB 87]KVV13754.1 hypothetical protein AP058_03122 [Flavobacterium sp. TAB 87]